MNERLFDREIKRYDFKIESDGSQYFSVPAVKTVESLGGQYCLSYHIDQLEDEILKLRTKYNDWESL